MDAVCSKKEQKTTRNGLIILKMLFDSGEMMKKYLFTLLGCFLLTGCGDEMPPKCDSKDAENILKEIYTREGFKKPTIVNQKTLRTDNDNKQYLCQAYLQEATLMKSGSFKYSITWQDKQQKIFYVQLID
ncbi:hypothetical protein [Gilliamella sp. Nev3-1]|uniref:hypothetical protein n=2 Tax=unclassified Gilliamella TaxID=2685620 RepID=UPI0011479146|nr:hypothetical protein [Gilliamella apicola]